MSELKNYGDIPDSESFGKRETPFDMLITAIKPEYRAETGSIPGTTELSKCSLCQHRVQIGKDATFLILTRSSATNWQFGGHPKDMVVCGHGRDRGSIIEPTELSLIANLPLKPRFLSESQQLDCPLKP